MSMRQLLILWLGLFMCGEAGAQSPTSVAELHERWIDLLRITDGDISARTFEKVIGLELLVTTHGADGAIARSMQTTRLDGSSLIANVRTHPGGKFMSASLEWTPGYFAVLTGRSCVSLEKLTEDLAALDWKVRPDGGSTFAVLFQRNDNLAAYGNTVEGRTRRCRLYYQSHYFDPAWLDRGRPVPAKEPEG
jgi:hypothetical protein